MMKNNIFTFVLQSFTFQADRWLTAAIGILFLFCLWGFLRQRLSQQERKLFWIGFGAVALCIGLTLGLYHWRLPRGLSGQYSPNLSWTPVSAGELERYFEADGTGRRVDRFINFNSNDFNLHTFREQPFSVEWQGFVYIPADEYHLNLVSSFDAELFVNGILTDTSFEGAETVDLGTPKARPFLLKGWSFDEASGGSQPFGFVWAANDDTTLLLRVENETDYQLQFRCYPFSYPGSPQQEVSVFLENVFVQKVVLQEGWRTYTLDIPQEILEGFVPGSIPLTFAFSHVAKPSEVLGSQDSRELAAAFDVVSLRQKTNEITVQPSAQMSNTAPELPQGWYRVRLKAKTLANKRLSHIRLTWGRGQRDREHLVPEDVLFPEATGSFQSFLTHIRLERVFLHGLIVYKCLVLFFLAGWLGWVIIRPNYHIIFEREVIFLLFICLVAFGVRVAFLMERSVIDPNFYLIQSGTDQANYVAYARGIFRGYWPSLTHAPFYFNVLNAFYIALTFVLCGENLFATRLISAGLSVASIVFVYLVARRAFQKPVAYIASILCACNGVLIFYDTSLIISPLKIFLTLGAIWLLMGLQDNAEWKTTIAAGVFLGLSALARATVFLFMPIVLLWMLWRMPVTFFRKILHCLILVVVMLATISPVTIRNYYSNDDHPFVLITGGVAGLNLWAANNPSSNGMFGYSPQLYQEIKARINREETTFFNEVITFVKERPLNYLHLEYKKLKYFWRGYEPGNLLSYYIFRNSSGVLGFPWLNFLIIGPLSLVGLFLARKTWTHTWLLYGFAGMQMGLLLMFWVLARYRLIVVPILSIFAAYTVWTIYLLVRQKHWYRALITFGMCVFFYVLLNYPDAARYYQHHHGQPMSASRIVRYWDLFEW